MHPLLVLLIHHDKMILHHQIVSFFLFFFIILTDDDPVFRKGRQLDGLESHFQLRQRRIPIVGLQLLDQTLPVQADIFHRHIFLFLLDRTVHKIDLLDQIHSIRRHHRNLLHRRLYDLFFYRLIQRRPRITVSTFHTIQGTLTVLTFFYLIFVGIKELLCFQRHIAARSQQKN